MAIISRFNLTVLRTMASYAAADCPIRQDAHRRMALVIARIWRAEERERAKRAQGRKYVDREKLFSSSSSAECTEVAYAAERYSEPPPPVGTKTDKAEPVQLKRRRDFAQRIQVEHDSSRDEVPTASSSIYLRKNYRQIDHSDMLQRRLAHSTKLLRDAERIAIGDGSDPAPQAVRPLAPIIPLDWKRFSSSKICCLAPLPMFRGSLLWTLCPGPPRLRMRPAKITRHKLYFQRTSLKHIAA